jgi:hypothetical protein
VEAGGTDPGLCPMASFDTRGFEPLHSSAREFDSCQCSIKAEISGSHGSEYEDDCLLGCCAM